MKVNECIAVVTGGASGLGEATVRNLMSGGARAAILDLQVDKGKKLAKELNGSVIFADTDVTSEESVQAAINKTIDAFGGINVAINCAGIAMSEKILGKKGPMSLANFNRQLQVNLVGTVNVIRLAVEKMAKNAPNEEGERGVIVNTASCAAFEGQSGQAAYSASKAGVLGMTLPIARECAEYGIRIMTIAPGLFDTPFLDILPEKVLDALAETFQFPHRRGKPSEYAQLVRHIIENPMLNGEAIRLDGAARMPAR